MAGRRHTPLAPGRIMMSDLARIADWRGAIDGLPENAAVILRDYDAPSRDALAQQMAAHCRQRGVAFLVAGDARLAQRLGAGFHCPSYLITRRPQFLASGFSTAAVHNLRQMVQAAQMGFGTVLLSPAFETASHPDAPAWGAVRFSGLARAGQQMGLQVFALGGIDDARWGRLKEAHDTLSGFAAISYFRPANGL